MIKKWDIAPAPNDKNPGRHKLLIKGEMKDIFLIVKKLGSVCSRPEKSTGDYNFLIYLSKVEMDTLAKVKALAAELGKPSEETPPRAAAQAAEPQPFELPKPKLKLTTTQTGARPPAPAPRAPEPAPQPQAKAPPPAAPPEEKAKTESERLTPAGPPPAAKIKKEEPPPAEAPRPVPVPKPAEVRPGISSRTGKTKWSVELPLIPTYSFQTLVSGSHNRFAHAAAMAVVENPGMIYNPLLIFGIPGTGKTHFIHAISYGLSSSIGQSNIFVTDGIKLSKGVDMAVKDGSIKKLADTISKVKALIIDDIHLLMLTESNKQYISKWLNEFMTANKQIVVTSVFPPKSLGGLEEAAGFQFTQGWMVDLKAPATASYKSILTQILQGMDVKLSDDEVNSIFASRSMPFGEAAKTLESMRRLEKFMANSETRLTHSMLLDMLLGLHETAVGGALADGESDEARAWNPPLKDSWFKWGMFYPRGMADEAKFVLMKMQEKIQTLSLRIEWQQVFLEEYNPDELYGINFKIGNYASEKGANGVIVMGPQPASALGTQEAGFRHITLKILDSFLVKGAWIPAGGVKSQAVYIKALMDLI